MKLKHGEKSIDNTRERTVHGKVKGKAVQGASSARWLNRLDEKDKGSEGQRRTRPVNIPA